MVNTIGLSDSIEGRNRISERCRGATGLLYNQSILYAMVLIALLVVLSGCGSGQSDVGQVNGNSVPVSLSISMPQESAAASTNGSRFWATVQSWLPSLSNAWAVTADLRTLTVEATGPGIPSPITSQPIPLSAPTSGQIITADVEVPVGPDRVFIAHGFDAAGLEIFKGESSPITLTAGQAASVDVILIDITTGTVTGTVTNAGTGTSLSNATVAVNGTSIRTTTNSDGNFTLSGVTPGPRTLAISASGFTSTTRAVTVVAGTSISTDSIALTLLPPSDPVRGTVTNAVNGRPIPGASVRIVNTNLQTSTDTNGSFTLNDVPQGPQTVTVTATGFIANSVTVNVVPGQTQPVGISLSPVTLNPGQIRIILNWSSTPNDLDAHLLVPTTSTTEVCFSKKGTLTSSPFAQLDTDEKFHSNPGSGLGPETITIAAPSAVPPPRFAGTYTYFVRNFRLAERDLLTSSGASIQVVTGDNDTEIARFTIPTTGTGRDWEVFTLDGVTGSITPVEGNNGRITTIPTTQCQ